MSRRIANTRVRKLMYPKSLVRLELADFVTRVGIEITPYSRYQTYSLSCYVDSSRSDKCTKYIMLGRSCDYVGIP